MNKSLAIICNYDLRPNRIGGMDRFFKLFNTKLKENGFKVKWFFLKYEPFGFYQDFEIITPQSGEKITECFLKYIKYQNLSFDILISHFIETISPFYKKCKLLGIKKVIAVDHMPRPLEGYAIGKKLKRKIKGLLYSKYTDEIIGVSSYIIDMTKNDYGKKASKKVQVIYNGIDVDKFHYKTDFHKKDTVKFIVPTNLRPEKGIQDLILAVNSMNTNITDKFTIDIFGIGSHEDVLKKMVLDTNLSNIISFKGSTTELHKLFAEYDYTIQPTYMEVFSLTILESLASNVPVITTPVGGNLEAVTDGVNGFIFNPKDQGKLAEIMTRIISNKLEIKNKDLRTNIELNFTVELMVENHFNTLKCI